VPAVDAGFVRESTAVNSVPRISRHLAETSATAGFQREYGLGEDGQLCLAERASGTCSQSITLLLKPAPLLGYWRTKALKPSLPV